MYYTHVDVRFVPPTNPGPAGNGLDGDPCPAVDYAAIVERAMTGEQAFPRPASPRTPSGDRMARDREAVTLIDNRRQPRTTSRVPVLSVDVVAESEPALQARLDDLLRAVSSATDAEQDLLGIPEERRVTTVISPEAPAVQVIGGGSSRALRCAWAAVTERTGAAFSRARSRPAGGP